MRYQPLPFSGENVTVQQSLQVQYETKFDIELQTGMVNPDTDGTKNETIECPIDVDIVNGGNVIKHISVTKFIYMGEIGFEKIKLFRSDQEQIKLDSGEYVVVFKGKSNCDSLLKRGGMINISEFSTTESFLWLGFRRFLVYLFVLSGSIALLVLNFKKCSSDNLGKNNN